MNMTHLKELVFILQELISYGQFIANAKEIATRAIPKGMRDYEQRLTDSFNYTLEVHVGNDVKNKFVRAKYLEGKLYENSKKYSPLIHVSVSKALTQAVLIYEGFLESQKNKSGLES